MLAPDTYRDHGRKLLVLGLPLVGSNLAHVLIGLTDTLMLGWYSVEALAAQVIASILFFTVFIVGSGFAFAVMPLVAKHAEAGEVTELRRVTRMGLWASIVFGLVCLPFLLSGEWVLARLGQGEDLLPLAGAYIRILGWAIFPSLIVMTLQSYLSALERTQIVLLVTVATAIMNGFLNWVLIFGNLGAPELGIRGAAYASISMHVATVVILIAYVRWAEPGHQLFRRLWRADWVALGQVARHGLPIGATNLAEMSLFATSAIFMGWLGTVPLAAHGIAMQLASLNFVVHLGLSSAATVRAGRAVGRHDPYGLRRGGAVAIAMSLLMSAVAITIFVSFPETIAALFIGPDEPQREAIIVTAGVLLLMAAGFQTVDGLQVIGLGLLRGLTDTTVPMIYATIAYFVVGIPMSYILGFTFGLGGVGVWAGLGIGPLVASVLLIGRFWRKTGERVKGH